jgi:hypothetical protein
MCIHTPLPTAGSRGPESNITDARRHTTIMATTGVTIITTVTARYRH